MKINQTFFAGSLLWTTALLLPSVITAQGDGSVAASCPMTCENGGTCQVGTADFSIHPKESNGTPLLFLQETSREGWFCNCTDQWTGIRCGRAYQVCPTKTFETPHVCYNGGTCLEGMEENENVTSHQRFCDCSKAKHNGLPYFGKYCEIPGAEKCGPESQVFCTAQGTCKDGFEEKAHPCNCPKGHRGPHCEFLRDEVPDCVLDCQNGGECTLGLKSFEEAEYQNLWSTHDGNYQYCTCPKDWFGDACEFAGVRCGKAHCFNGGACLETLNENGEITYACDCRSAYANGKPHAGQYCEAQLTTSCAHDDGFGTFHPDGHLFCTNHGVCKHTAHLGCECPTGFHGHSCEFKNAEDAVCKLDCQNGGVCRKGKKDSALLDSLGEEMKHYNVSHSQLFEHCVCPDGYFGIQCEHKLEICPGGDHVCLHGSNCVAQNEGEGGEVTSHKCDCDHGFDAIERYAGKFCQYTSTDICTKNGQPGVGKANFAFCVNNGICKGKVENNEPHPGCTCEEGFTGDHCEFLKGTGNQNQNVTVSDGSVSNGSSTSTATVSTTESTNAKQSNQNVIVAVSSLLVAVLVISGFLILRVLVDGGRSANKGKTAAEAGDAVAEAEKEASTAADVASIGSVKVPFDEQPQLLSHITPRYDEADEEFQDIEEYSNDQSDASTLTEDEMSNVQLV